MASTVQMLQDLGLIAPIIISVAYWTSIKLFQPSKEEELKAKQEQKKSKNFEPTLLNFIVIIHNLLLCIFSVLCFANTFPVLLNLVVENGVYKGLCGVKPAYDSTVYGYWSYLFYLSKYYEVVDTYIVILKKRRPINLQIYHHIGAMIGCAWFHYDKSVGSFIFMVPNSFVHSIMYLYYALSTLKIKIPFKFIITYIQMIQFLFGHCCIIYVLFYLYPECITLNEKYCLQYHFVYISWLFWMFARFFNKTYNKKKSKKKE